MAADISDIVNGGDQAGEAFMVLRAGLPAVGQLLGTSAQLVRTQPLQLLALAVENTEVRAEELVAGACQEVAIEGAHINRPVRRVMHRVDERHRPGRVCQAHNLIHVVDGSHRVGCPSHGHQPRVAANLGRQVEHVERAIGGLDVGGAHLYATLLQAHPRRHIRVVVETGDQQLVAALQLAADGAAQGESQRRHVGAEDDFIGRAIEEVGHRRASVGDHLVGSAAGDESATRIRVEVRKIVGDGINHPLRNLGAAGSVEEHRRLAVHILLQRGKLLPHPTDVQLACLVRRFLHWKTYLRTPDCVDEIGEQTVGRRLRTRVALAYDKLGKDVGFEADEQRRAADGAQRIAGLQPLRSNGGDDTAVGPALCAADQPPSFAAGACSRAIAPCPISRMP